MDRNSREPQPSPASTSQPTKSEPFDDATVYLTTPGADRLKKYSEAPKEEPCPFCGKMRRAYGFRCSDFIVWMNELTPCDCEGAVKERERLAAEAEKRKREEEEAERQRQLRERVKRLIGDCGMGARFLRRTFATFETTEENRTALLTCQRYAERFRELLPNSGKVTSRNGIFITGPTGTGKTHLAAAIANKLLHEGIAVVCMTMIDILDKVKEAYDGNRDESGILHTYSTVSLLVIDDMGKEQTTEWGVAKIYKIINARYEAMLPTIITTNYSDAELLKRLTPRETGDPNTAIALIDRLREMCIAIVTTGESWRRK